MVALAGCGGGSAVSTVPSSPAALAQGSTSSTPDAVAYVSGVPIPTTSYKHWLSVEKALGSTDAANQTLGFLITSEWMVGEAAARHIAVSEAEVKQHFAQLTKQGYSTKGSLQKLLPIHIRPKPTCSHARRPNCSSPTSWQATAGKSSAQSKAILASFEKNFQKHWKHYTTCKSAYVMEDCSSTRAI